MSRFSVEGMRTPPQVYAWSRFGEPEYTTWLDEELSWKETCYIGDWSFLWQNWTVTGLVALYVVCGTGAYLLTALAIRDAGEATNPSLLEITYPLFIVIFTAMFLGKVHLDSRGIIGAVLIVVGCALVLWSQGGPKPEM